MNLMAIQANDDNYYNIVLKYPWLLTLIALKNLETCI